MHRVAVQQELIVIPAESGADGPVAKADQILHERGLLEVRAISRESECERSARIELARIHRDIGNDVVETLVQESVVRFHARFPFMAPVMNGDAAFEISFAERIVLEN